MKYLGFLVIALLMGGCAPKIPEPSTAKEQHLYSLIANLDSSINRNEAKKLAHEATAYSMELAHKYKIQSSPWVHNFLVNIGLKKRGLCYQWADDLMRHLWALHLKSVKILPIGANIGEYWTEHNAIVVLPSRRDISLGQGVILDAWRHSGDLYYEKAENDTKYKWRVRTERLDAVKQ